MEFKKIKAEVRIRYDRPGFEAPTGHHVRTSLEATVCEWLMEHGVAHRHATEIFMVPTGPGRIPRMYVPDIILHDRRSDGKTVIIEPFQPASPKGGGTKLFASFREQMKARYYLIVVARKPAMPSLVKGSYDVLVDIARLDTLLKKLPRVPR